MLTGTFFMWELPANTYKNILSFERETGYLCSMPYLIENVLLGRI